MTLQPVPLSDGTPGYPIKQPREWVAEFGPALQMSLVVLKASFLAARLIGLPISLPAELVDGAENLLSAASSGSSAVEEWNEMTVGGSLELPTSDDFIDAYEAAESNESGQLDEAAKDAWPTQWPGWGQETGQRFKISKTGQDHFRSGPGHDKAHDEEGSER